MTGCHVQATEGSDFNFMLGANLPTVDPEEMEIGCMAIDEKHSGKIEAFSMYGEGVVDSFSVSLLIIRSIPILRAYS